MHMKTIKNIKKGDELTLTGRATENLRVRFEGWTGMESRYSWTLVFGTLGEVLAHYNCKNVRELEEKQDAMDEKLGYGHHVYALFSEWDPQRGAYGELFKCYIWKGKLRAGSSADRVGLNGPTHEEDGDKDTLDV